MAILAAETLSDKTYFASRTLALLSERLDSDEVRTVVWSPGRSGTFRWILHHVLEHEAYHLGQAVLLSLMRERLKGSASGV